MPESSVRLRLALILSLALGARLGMLLLVNPYYWYGGMSTHFGIASEYIFQGKGYAMSRSLSEKVNGAQDRDKRLLRPEEFRRDLPEDHYLTMERPPAYSILLAASYKATGSHRYEWVQALQAALDSSVCLLLFLIARQWSVQAGLLAALLYAVWPPMVRNSVMILPESFLPFLTTLLLCFLLKGMREDKLRWLLGAAACNGLACHLRTELAALGVFLWPAFLLAWPKGWRSAPASALLLAVSLLSLSPWLARNYKVSGRFMPTSSSGPAFMVGLGEYPNPYGLVPENKSVEEALERQGIMDPIAKDLAARRWFRRIVSENPWLYASSVPKRFLRYLFPRMDWGLVEYFSNRPSYEEFRKAGGTRWGYLRRFPLLFLLKVGPPLFDLMFILTALAGFAIGAASGWRQAYFLLGIPLLFIGTRAMIAYDPRHAVPGLAPYAALFALALTRLLRRTHAAPSPAYAGQAAAAQAETLHPDTRLQREVHH